MPGSTRLCSACVAITRSGSSTTAPRPKRPLDTRGGKHGKGGDLIYRWGNPAAYKRGTERDKQLVQQHDAEWIPEGYPGAGHITIFNNGYDRGWSSIEEIVPPVRSARAATSSTPAKPMAPRSRSGTTKPKNRTDFFSSEISGAHRLPNGNTLICAGVDREPVRGHSRRRNGLAVRQPDGARRHPGARAKLPGKDVRGHLFDAVSRCIATRPIIPA